MITFLRKIFIKDYKNIDNPKVRLSHGKLAAGFGIFSNSILFILKFVFGLISNSISIIGDSINNLSDFASSIISLVGFKVSGKPADKKHPFGHQRIEYICGVIISIFIIGLALLTFYESIMKVIDGSKTSFTIVSFVILGVSIIIKIIQGFFYLKISKIIKSVALKASAVDSFTDTISTFLILISALISYFANINLDGFIGTLVAIFIGYVGVKMVIESSGPLIGESTNSEEVKRIVDEILSYNGVLGIHDLVAHNYGPTKTFMTIHVEVDSKVDIIASHDLVDSIELDIKQKYNVELTIHMDPIDISNPETLRLREKLVGIIKEIDEDINMHDFRVVHGKSHKNILFDIVLPFEKNINENDIINKINEQMKKGEKGNIYLIINIDHPFVE